MEIAPTVFALFDAARMGPWMEQAKEIHPAHASLYRGRSEAVLAPFAPHLFRFDSDTELSRWFFTHGWGQAWGIFCCSSASADELLRHFRRFLKVGLEDGKPFYFRFYDPRVLRGFLPTCGAEQLRLFFGLIDYFWVEDEDPDFGLYYWFDAERGELVTHRVSRLELKNAFCAAI